MRRDKRIAVLFLGFLTLLLCAGEAFAQVRVFLGPWWPVPVIVAPVGPPPYPEPPFPPPPPPGVPRAGFVDTNVRPKDALVAVDGEHRGLADDFNGVPAYLALAPGRHRLEFSRNGYEPVSLVVTIVPGEVVSVDLAMREQRESAPAEERSYQLETEGTGFVQFEIEPADAAVYIDDAFYGPASQFREANHKIMLRAGRHTVEIGRPGYVLYRGTITVVASETTRVEVSLNK